MPEALAQAKHCLEREARHEETLGAIVAAERMVESGLPAHAAIAELGRGWVAEAALAISIYCALVARDFRHGVILAVNHDGDSDSTGSITSNLLGTMLGVEAHPSEWLCDLELRDVVEEVATDLYAFPEWRGERVAEENRRSGSGRSIQESSGRPRRHDPEGARSRPQCAAKVPR